MIEFQEVCHRFLGACERIANSWSLEEGLSGLVQTVMSLLKPRSAAIMLFGRDDGVLKIIASRGLSAHFLNHTQIDAENPGIQRVLTGGEDVRLDRIDPADPVAAVLRLENDSGALMATPIVAMNRPIGLMIATSAQEGRLADDHLLLLKLAARVAASCYDRCALYEERRRSMAIDPQTGLWSFEFFANRMVEEIARSRRQEAPVSLALVDIDGFLRYRQVHGHEKADQLFLHFVEVARSAVRGIDFMGRFGLDEIVVALPSTDLRGGVKAAERIRQAAEQGDFPKSPDPITASIGVATLAQDETQPGPMIERARRALYATYLKGGNCVCGEGET